MAKRKRLTPANPVDLETKSMTRLNPNPLPRAPIADVVSDVSSRVALEEVSDVLNRARSEGRMVLPLPLSDIDLTYLIRDRVVVDAAEMEALKLSLKDRGQQFPVEVVELSGGRYGLISGWRRCQALLALLEETADPRFASVLALLRKPAEMSEAYLAMVEENEIRADLSFFERARIAAKAVDQGVFESEKKALLTLFRSASRAKRSKIRSFLSLVRAFDGALMHPQAIGERLGLSLSKRLGADAHFADRVRRHLSAAAEDRNATEELDVLNKALSPRLESKLTSPSTAWTDQEVRPGLTVRQYHRKKKVEVWGEGVSDDFRHRLVRWLAQQT